MEMSGVNLRATLNRIERPVKSGRRRYPIQGAEVVNVVKRPDPDVLWVGMSTPKQERWMYEHRDKLRVPVMVGAGAAFDLNVGRVRQAPRWMRENGLEWLWRLIQEPRRLWRRYLCCRDPSLFSALGWSYSD